MNISLPDPMKAFVEAQSQDGRYSNVSDYMRDLIRRDQDRKQAVAEIQVLIEAGLASGPSQLFDMAAFIAEQKAKPRA